MPMEKISLEVILRDGKLMKACRNSVAIAIEGRESLLYVRSSTYNKIMPSIKEGISEGYVQLSDKLGTYWLLIPQL